MLHPSSTLNSYNGIPSSDTFYNNSIMFLSHLLSSSSLDLIHRFFSQSFRPQLLLHLASFTLVLPGFYRYLWLTFFSTTNTSCSCLINYPTCSTMYITASSHVFDNNCFFLPSHLLLWLLFYIDNWNLPCFNDNCLLLSSHLLLCFLVYVDSCNLPSFQQQILLVVVLLTFLHVTPYISLLLAMLSITTAPYYCLIYPSASLII